MLRTIGLVTSLVFLMVACGGGGGGAVGGGTGGVMSAPSDLQYGGTIGYRGAVGTPFGPYEPTVTGTVTGYSVSPVLPTGLSHNPTWGVISGTPLTASPETICTITASNDGGAATFALTLTVLVPPSALTYPSPLNGTVGVALTSLVPTYSGDADAFAILPALPAGLILDPTTGVVSGTPARARHRRRVRLPPDTASRRPINHIRFVAGC